MSSTTPSTTEKLKILPIGGLGEVGMNCMLLEWAGEIVLVDCGIQFPDASYPGVDLLTPDLTYVRSRLDKIRGVVITHGHDDHIGALPFLAKDVDLDVYCTKFPEGLLRNKLSEYDNLKDVRYHEIKPREVFQVGPFSFDPIRVQHSIIEALAFVIQTPVGVLVHTGDFKHDANELVPGENIGFTPFEEWSDKGVLLLLSDSTNAERHGHTLSELDIARSFESILAGQTGRMIIALFASNIRRIEKLMHICHSHGKKVALAGRSMHSYIRLAHEQGSIKLPPETLVMLENSASYDDDKFVVLATGSQAEPQSALVRIAQGTHKDFKIRNGDRIIMSSRFIPGNERNITSMIDHLYRQGAEVMYESIHQIHVSGHGFQDELMMMLKANNPKFFIPVHGEYRHLAKHARLAKDAGVAPENIKIIEDGQWIEIDEETMVLGEKLELQKGVVVDGFYMEGNREIFTQRNNLAKTGIVFSLLFRDPETLKLKARPVVTSYGMLFRKDVNMTKSLDEAEEIIMDLYAESARRPDLEEMIRLELRRYFKKRTSHKPVVIPLVLDS